MDTSKLGQGERIAGIAGIALFIIMFFSWFGVGTVNGVDVGALASAAGIDTTANAWQSFSWIDLLLFITVLAAVGLAVLALTEGDVGLPVAASAVVTGLGALSTILVLYRIINPPDSASRKYGVFLGLIAAVAVTYGGWLTMQEEGTSFGGEADRFRGGPGEGPSTGGPPPAS